LRTMSRPASAYSDDVTVYLVLNAHGQFGIAYDETDPAEADRETIPYRGGPPAVTDLTGGQVQVMFDSMPSSIEHSADRKKPQAIGAHSSSVAEKERRPEHSLGRLLAGSVGAVRGRKVVFRAGFAGKENSVIDWDGENRAFFRVSGQSIGVRAQRKAVGAPCGGKDHAQPLAKCAAHDAGEFGRGKISECLRPPPSSSRAKLPPKKPSTSGRPEMRK
jgi:hypothetical protein